MASSSRWRDVAAGRRSPRRGPPAHVPGRFGVGDVRAARERLAGRGVEVSPVTSLPGVVAFVDFADPWGNTLGFYQDLAPSGQQPVVGGSVHDRDLFISE